MNPSVSLLAYLAICVAYGAVQSLSAAAHRGEDRRARIREVRTSVLIGFALLALARLAHAI